MEGEKNIYSQHSWGVQPIMSLYDFTRLSQHFLAPLFLDSFPADLSGFIGHDCRGGHRHRHRRHIAPPTIGEITPKFMDLFAHDFDGRNDTSNHPKIHPKKKAPNGAKKKSAHRNGRSPGNYRRCQMVVNHSRPSQVMA